MKRLAGLLLGLACAAACADAEDDRLRALRKLADAQLVLREQECAGRFVVSSCVAAARTEHREAVADVRRQTLQRDETRRRTAAETRRRTLAEKTPAHGPRASEPAPEEEVRPRTRREPPTPAAPWAVPALPSPQAAKDRALVAQQSRERFEARQRAAQARRQEAETRDAQRLAKGKLAAPLPVPLPLPAPERAASGSR